jgi:hypothetical protein
MLLGDARFQYPENHIEADNRLSWFLGKLDKHFGKDAMYVHLTRNNQETAKSYAKRYGGIFGAYKTAILLGLPRSTNALSVSLDYCETVNSNIELFLKDKPNWMSFTLETAKADFQEFWERSGAEGDLEAALTTFDMPSNASKLGLPEARLVVRTMHKIIRIGKTLPAFVKNA